MAHDARCVIGKEGETQMTVLDVFRKHETSGLQPILDDLKAAGFTVKRDDYVRIGDLPTVWEPADITESNIGTVLAHEFWTLFDAGHEHRFVVGRIGSAAIYRMCGEMK
jgi:hypothetical protein